MAKNDSIQNKLFNNPVTSRYSLRWSSKIKVKKNKEPILQYRGKSKNLDDYMQYEQMKNNGKVEMTRGSRFQNMGFCGACHPSPKSKSMDSKIGKTKQGAIGDCWLLAAINSIRATKKGRQIIKDSIKYTNDGAYVKFRGLNTKIFIPYSKVQSTKISSAMLMGYSRGDDDMKVIELAVNKVLQEHAKGNIKVKEGIEFNIGNNDNINKSNWSNTVFVLLTGNKQNKNCSTLTEFKKINYDAAVYSFAFQYPTKFSIMDGCRYREVTDLRSGKKVRLYARHAYSIAKIYPDGSVLLVNPWNNDLGSRETILVSGEEIEKGKYQSVSF